MKYKFSQEQKEEIKAARRGNRDKQIDKRLEVLELRCEGISQKEISEKTGYHRSYICKLIKLYFEKGLQAVAETHYCGNRRNMSICEDNNGNVFVSFERTDETELSENPMLTHCLAVVKLDGDYLLGRNKWRGRYEIFGGCTERGETARECIIRECGEELGLNGIEPVYLGAMKFLMKPDFFSPNERTEYGGLYGITLHGMSVSDICEQIRDKEEIVELALYSRIKGIEPIAEIDEKLLEYYA